MQVPPICSNRQQSFGASTLSKFNLDNHDKVFYNKLFNKRLTSHIEKISKGVDVKIAIHPESLDLVVMPATYGNFHFLMQRTIPRAKITKKLLLKTLKDYIDTTKDLISSMKEQMHLSK